MAARIDKTIARLQTRIEAKEYYEAHQQLRVISARYIKTSQYPLAASILFTGAQSLFAASQTASAADIALLLIDVYNKASWLPSPEHTQRLTTLLRLFPALTTDEDEALRKRFVAAAVSWSAHCGPCPAGDPDLHHVIGAMYAAEKRVYDAERHLILGTKDSPAVLVKLEFEWYVEMGERAAAGSYAARGVLPYLLVGNLRSARQVLDGFKGRLDGMEGGAPQAKTVPSAAGGEEKVYAALPGLNFLTLLIAAVPYGAPEVWRSLVGHYREVLSAGEEGDGGPRGWADALEGIAEMWFGVQAPRQGNPLMDMMGSLLGGGMMGGGGGGGVEKRRRIEGRKGEKRAGEVEQPPAADLD